MSDPAAALAPASDPRPVSMASRRSSRLTPPTFRSACRFNCRLSPKLVRFSLRSPSTDMRTAVGLTTSSTWCHRPSLIMPFDLSFTTPLPLLTVSTAYPPRISAARKSELCRRPELKTSKASVERVRTSKVTRFWSDAPRRGNTITESFCRKLIGWSDVAPNSALQPHVTRYRSASSPDRLATSNRSTALKDRCLRQPR